jgi:hypothetical protein
MSSFENLNLKGIMGIEERMDVEEEEGCICDLKMS